MIVVLLNRAEEFRRLLDSGAVRNQADLARKFCLTRARVTQLLQLRDLEPSIKAYARSLPPGTPTNMVTERGLRLLLKLPSSVQLRKAKRTVLGFSEYLTGLPFSTHPKLLDDDLVQTRVALLSISVDVKTHFTCSSDTVVWASGVRVTARGVVSGCDTFRDVLVVRVADQH